MTSTPHTTDNDFARITNKIDGATAKDTNTVEGPGPTDGLNSPRIGTPAGISASEDPEKAEVTQEASTDPASTLRPALARVYALLCEDGPMTDEELTARIGSTSNKVSPRRLDLVKAGLVEKVGVGTTTSGKSAAIWSVVPVERVDEARRHASERQPRRRRVEDLPLETRKVIVERLLRDRNLNEAILADRRGAIAAERARREARAIRTDRERLRRELKAHIDEAERTASPIVHFLKLKRNLRNATDGMQAAVEFVDEDVAKAADYGGALLPASKLEELEGLFIEVRDLSEDALRVLGRALGHHLDDVIDVEALDFDDFALPERSCEEDLGG